MASTRVTIQDIADKVGLSKFSVSRALSGKSGVGKDTRNKVLRAAHAMGYRGQILSDQPQGQILFVRQEIDPVLSELWLNMMHGAEIEAERLGYTIVPRQAQFLENTNDLDPAIVGLILAVPRPSDLGDVAARTGLPVVCASYVGPLDNFDQVVGADWEAGMSVARMLTDLGHRNVAFVHGSSVPLGRAERFRGFYDGMMQFSESRVDDIVFDEAIGFRRAMLSYLEEGGRPTALFCAHDGIAVTAISELLRFGIQVPDDVSVVGFNDFASARQISPRLTTVRTPQVEMGAAMVRRITDRIFSSGENPKPPIRISLAGEIVQRESTGPAEPAEWVKRVLSVAKLEK